MFSSQHHLGGGDTGKKRNEPRYDLVSSGKKRHGGGIGSDGEGENHLRVRVDRASLVRPWVAQSGLRKTPSLRLGLLGGWWNRDSDLPDLVIGGWRLPESVWKGLINVVL